MTASSTGGAPRRRTARALSFACTLAGAAVLAACQTTSPTLSGTHEWRSLPPGQLAAQGPDGPFDGVEGRERRTSLEVYQQMALANETTVPGQNEIVVMADVASFWATRQGVPRLGDYSFTAPEISRMISEAFEGASDIRDPALRRNDYGPFYVVEAYYPGRANCVLAWQVLDNREGDYPFGAKRVTTRYRKCDPSKSTAELLADFQGLRLTL